MNPYYDHGGITIYHGDAREIVPTLPKAELVVTDPPYGYAYQSGWESTWGGSQIANDHDTSARDSVLQLLTGIPAIVFGSWKRPRPEGTRAILIWDKGATFGMGDLKFPWKPSFEEIYIIGDGFAHERRDEGVIRGHWVPFAESQGRAHPNQKPVSLMAYLMQRHPGQSILDPFMGSGTTLVAAKQAGRRAVGIELNEAYCEIAAKRLSQEMLPFAPDPAPIAEQPELFGGAL